MEQVLDVYKRPYNSRLPVVCMDETPRQLIKETRIPIPGKRGRLERHDYEYERCGVYTVFMANEPLAGRRFVKSTERKTRFDWAEFIKDLAGRYKKAKKIILVMDNLSTHKAGSLYETFPPEEAKKLWERFEFVYTPTHGSWLNMAEIELNVMIRQCLNGRFGSLDKVATAIAAWQRHRDNLKKKVQWQFTTQDARIKLRRLYPTLET
jgi:DDE superfamily endonuclease